jgi:hypothetical protein
MQHNSAAVKTMRGVRLRGVPIGYALLLVAAVFALNVAIVSLHFKDASGDRGGGGGNGSVNNKGWLAWTPKLTGSGGGINGNGNDVAARLAVKSTGGKSKKKNKTKKRDEMKGRGKGKQSDASDDDDEEGDGEDDDDDDGDEDDEDGEDDEDNDDDEDDDDDDESDEDADEEEESADRSDADDDASSSLSSLSSTMDVVVGDIGDADATAVTAVTKHCLLDVSSLSAKAKQGSKLAQSLDALSTACTATAAHVKLRVSAAVYKQLHTSIIALSTTQTAAAAYAMENDVAGWTLYFRSLRAATGRCVKCDAANAPLLLIPETSIKPLRRAWAHFMDEKWLRTPHLSLLHAVSTGGGDDADTVMSDETRRLLSLPANRTALLAAGHGDRDRRRLLGSDGNGDNARTMRGVTNDVSLAGVNGAVEVFLKAQLANIPVFLCAADAAGGDGGGGAAAAATAAPFPFLGVGDGASTKISGIDTTARTFRPVADRWRLKRIVHDSRNGHVDVGSGSDDGGSGDGDADGGAFSGRAVHVAAWQLYGCTNQTLNCCQKKQPGYPKHGCRHVIDSRALPNKKNRFPVTATGVVRGGNGNGDRSGGSGSESDDDARRRLFEAGDAVVMRRLLRGVDGDEAARRAADARHETWVASAPCCRAHMIKLYLVLTRLLDKYRITYFLGYGSLLSAVRSPDANMNPYDYDFDLVIFRDDAARVLRLSAELSQTGYKINGSPDASQMQILYTSPHSIHRNVMDFFVLSEKYRKVHTPFKRIHFAGYNVLTPHDPHIHLGRGKYGKYAKYMNNIQIKTENWNNQTEGGDHFKKYLKPYNSGVRDDGAFPIASWARALRTRANAWLYERQMPDVQRRFPTCSTLDDGKCAFDGFDGAERQSYDGDYARRVRACNDMASKYGVKPGKTWGTLPKDMRSQFGRFDCNILSGRKNKPPSHAPGADEEGS